MNALRAVAGSVQRLVRRLPIWCAHDGCRNFRARGCYGFCRPCWAYSVRITWEALWTDHEDAPPAPWPPNATGSATEGRS